MPNTCVIRQAAGSFYIISFFTKNSFEIKDRFFFFNDNNSGVKAAAHCCDKSAFFSELVELCRPSCFFLLFPLLSFFSRCLNSLLSPLHSDCSLLLLTTPSLIFSACNHPSIPSGLPYLSLLSVCFKFLLSSPPIFSSEVSVFFHPPPIPLSTSPPQLFFFLHLPVSPSQCVGFDLNTAVRVAGQYKCVTTFVCVCVRGCSCMICRWIRSPIRHACLQERDFRCVCVCCVVTNISASKHQLCST